MHALLTGEGPHPAEVIIRDDVARHPQERAHLAEIGQLIGISGQAAGKRFGRRANGTKCPP